MWIRGRGDCCPQTVWGHSDCMEGNMAQGVPMSANPELQ